MKEVRESAAQKKFNNAIVELRNISRGNIPIETQIEVANTINNIQRYGFDFFPNHYVFDDILKLEGIIRQLKASKKSK